MAQRGWYHGWVPKIAWALPIKKVLADEREAARKKLIEEQDAKLRNAEAQREAEQKAAIEARTQEGQVVRLARSNALQVLAATARLLNGAQLLSERLKGALSEAMAPGSPTTMSPTTAMRIVASLARVTREANMAARLALELERIHLGEPVEYVGLKVDSTPEAAIAEVEAAQRALERYRAAGGIHLVPHTNADLPSAPGPAPDPTSPGSSSWATRTPPTGGGTAYGGPAPNPGAAAGGTPGAGGSPVPGRGNGAAGA